MMGQKKPANPCRGLVTDFGTQGNDAGVTHALDVG